MSYYGHTAAHTCKHCRLANTVAGPAHQHGHAMHYMQSSRHPFLKALLHELYISVTLHCILQPRTFNPKTSPSAPCNMRHVTHQKATAVLTAYAIVTAHTNVYFQVVLALCETAASASGASHPSHAYSQSSECPTAGTVPVTHARCKAHFLLVV